MTERKILTWEELKHALSVIQRLWEATANTSIFCPLLIEGWKVCGSAARFVAWKLKSMSPDWEVTKLSLLPPSPDHPESFVHDSTTWVELEIVEDAPVQWLFYYDKENNDFVLEFNEKRTS